VAVLLVLTANLGAAASSWRLGSITVLSHGKSKKNLNWSYVPGPWSSGVCAWNWQLQNSSIVPQLLQKLEFKKMVAKWAICCVIAKNIVPLRL